MVSKKSYLLIAISIFTVFLVFDGLEIIGAEKSKGTFLTQINSKLVCGDLLCSEIKKDVGGFGNCNDPISPIVNWNGCDLRHKDFTGADLSNANLDGAILEFVNFGGATLTGVSFANFDTSKISFAGCFGNSVCND